MSLKRGFVCWFGPDFVFVADFASWNLCQKWSSRVVSEFFSQGDAERALNLVISPNMDRSTADQYSISLGFIDFLCKPFFEVLSELLPGLKPMVETLLENRGRWAELQRAENEKEKEAREGGTESDPATAVEPGPPIPTISRMATADSTGFPSGPEEPESPHLLSPTVRSARTSIDSASDFTKSGRRFSAAAGVIDLPPADYFSKGRPPSTHGRGLAALHSFSAFMSWKRLNSGASTPNLVGLAQQAQHEKEAKSTPVSIRRLTPDAEGEDVLQAIGWDDFLATDSQDAPPRRRSGPNLSGLAMTLRHPQARFADKRSASVDVYGREEERKDKVDAGVAGQQPGL